MASSTGAQMSSLHDLPDRLEFRPMGLEEYLALPEGIHAEYVDGVAIVSPPATSGHNKLQRRIANAIEDGLSDEVDVRTEAGWQSGRRFRIPDIAVFATKDPDMVYDQSTPILVVEVLSPSTASEDTVRKSTEYLAAGIGQYWIVDRAGRSLVVYLNNGHEWEQMVVLDADRTTATVTVDPWGNVDVDLVALLRE